MTDRPAELAGLAYGRAPVLRVLSYLPNPRLAKATIAARLCGVSIEVRGAPPRELGGWLWDFDARPLEAEDTSVGTLREARVGFAGTLHKTDAFLSAHPFGTVPAAFSPDGKIGIFESNAIARAVVRLAPERTGLYGDDPYTASRIDAFLDASLVFARDVQVYLLKLAGGRVKPPTHERARAARDAYLAGIEQALAPSRAFLVGDALTLADIVFAAELALFSAERASRHVLSGAALTPLYGEELRETYPRALAHFARLCAHEAFAPDLGPYLEKLDARRESNMSEKQEFEMPSAGMPKWIRDHVELYLSDPERARLWDSTIGGGPGPLPTLLLIARGAKSGKLRPLPLLYQELDGKYVVIGSKGGAPAHPAWYVNLKGNPECEIRVGSKRMRARARTASGDERKRGWTKMAAMYPPYEDYQKRAGAREIPVVVLDPMGPA